MEKVVVDRWIDEYTDGIDINKIDWVVMDTYKLMNFYDKHYLDEDVWKYVSEDIIHFNPLGMHYLPLRKESPDIRYLLGICDNKIGKKTIIACITYVENYRLFVGQYTPLTYLCTCEINKYFRNRGLSKIMFDEFAKVINPNQHFISTPQSDEGEICHVFKNLYNSLINSGFDKCIILKDETTNILTPEYRELLCSNPVQLKMK